MDKGDIEVKKHNWYKNYFFLDFQRNINLKRDVKWRIICNFNLYGHGMKVGRSKLRRKAC